MLIDNISVLTTGFKDEKAVCRENRLIQILFAWYVAFLENNERSEK